MSPVDLFGLFYFNVLELPENQLVCECSRRSLWWVTLKNNPKDYFATCQTESKFCHF